MYVHVFARVREGGRKHFGCVSGLVDASFDTSIVPLLTLVMCSWIKHERSFADRAAPVAC